MTRITPGDMSLSVRRLHPFTDRSPARQIWSAKVAAVPYEGQHTKATAAFIAAAKAAGLRWGGDFRRRDPIHFDSGLQAAGVDYVMHLFFCQNSYRDQHPMRTA